ncbi:MAG: hypothetical protein AAF585_29270, partial [Verrucomicrobiota bacterium]
MKRAFCFLAALTAFGSSLAEEQPDVRAVIQKAVPYIEEKGVHWMEKRTCVSCHHTSFMVWSLNSAKQVGAEVSPEFKNWDQWATTWENLLRHDRREGKEREATIRRESDAVSQLIYGGAYERNGQDPTEYGKLLIEAQLEDGSWKPGGQLPDQKRPKRETQEASTMWVLLSVLNSGIEK